MRRDWLYIAIVSMMILTFAALVVAMALPT
jgi:hypothetical protein